MGVDTSASVATPSRDDYDWRPQQCPICRRPPGIRLGRRGGAAHRALKGVECEVWRCTTCGLIFPDPMPVPRRGLVQHYALPTAEYFAQHPPEARLEGSRRLISEAERLLGRTGRLLDVGSGRGEVLRVARERGWIPTGIDPSPTFAEHASRYAAVEVRVESIEECSLPADSFDAVILAAVLEHLYDPDAVIQKVSQLLREGGALFLDVPNEAGLFFKLGNLYQRLRLRDWVVNLSPTFSPFHVFGFTPASLRTLLAKHGLSPVRWSMYGGTTLVPATGHLLGRVEQGAARAVTSLSAVMGLGTYIEAWAVKTAAPTRDGRPRE